MATEILQEADCPFHPCKCTGWAAQSGFGVDLVFGRVTATLHTRGGCRLRLFTSQQQASGVSLQLHSLPWPGLSAGLFSHLPFPPDAPGPRGPLSPLLVSCACECRAEFCPPSARVLPSPSRKPPHPGSPYQPGTTHSNTCALLSPATFCPGA